MPSVEDLLRVFHVISLSHSEPIINGQEVIINNVLLDPKCISRYFQYPRTILVDKFTIPEMVIKVPSKVNEANPFIIGIKTIDYSISLNTHDEYEAPKEVLSYLLPFIKINIEQINCNISIGNVSLKLEMNNVSTETKTSSFILHFAQFNVVIENDGKKEQFIKDVVVDLEMIFTRDDKGHVISVEQKWSSKSISIICAGETYKLLAQSVRKIFSAVFSSKSIEKSNAAGGISLNVNELKVVLKDLLDGDIHVQIGKILFEMKNMKYDDESCMYVGKTLFSVGEFGVQYVLGEEISDIVWTIQQGNAVQLNVTKGVEKEGIKAKGIIGINVELQCSGLGITMDFKLLSKMIDLMKITMQKNLTKIHVDSSKIEELKEKTEKRKERFTSKYERFLKYLQLKSIIDLLGKVYFSFELKKSLFTVKFQSNSIFTIELGSLKLNNKPIKNGINTIQLCNDKLKKDFKPNEVKTPINLDISICVENIEAFGMMDNKKDTVFFANIFELQFNLIFDKESTKGIPSIIYCYGRSDDLEITLSHQMFMDIYSYIKDFVKGFQEKEKNRIKDIGKQIGSTVTENASKITDKSIEFVNNDLKNINFPTIALLFSFGKGKVVVPITSIIYRSKEHDCSKLTEIVRSELDLMFVSNEFGKTFGIIIDEISTGSVETLLEPLVSLSKKKMKKGFLFEKLPQTTPSLVLTLNHISSKIKSSKNISMDVKLYGVQVKLRKLGVFGKEMLKEVTEGKVETKIEKEEEIKEEVKEEIKEEEVKVKEVENKEENDKELNVKLKVIDFFKEKYHGFEFSVQMSECDVVAEDELHTIVITTSNKYVQSGEEICVDLNKKIEFEKAQQEGLEMEVAQLKVRLANLKQQQDLEDHQNNSNNSQTKKSRLAFWKK